MTNEYIKKADKWTNAKKCTQVSFANIKKQKKTGLKPIYEHCSTKEESRKPTKKIQQKKSEFDNVQWTAQDRKKYWTKLRKHAEEKNK